MSRFALQELKLKHETKFLLKLARAKKLLKRVSSDELSI